MQLVKESPSSVFEEQPPCFSGEEAERIAAEVYGVASTAEPLASERDQNFRLTTESGEEFVLKIANPAEKRKVLDLQNRAMAHVGDNDGSLLIPRVCRTASGEEIATMERSDATPVMVRMLTYLPGILLKDVQPRTTELLRSLGTFLARLDKAFANFSHPAAKRELPWDVKDATFVREHVKDVRGSEKRAIVEFFVSQFERHVEPVLPLLRKSVIHNDGNDYNVLVGQNGADEMEVVGIVDFGDMVHSALVCELAVALAYVMLDRDHPMTTAKHVVAGYHRMLPLRSEEVEVLLHLICMRLCTTVTMAAYRKKLFRENDYLVVTERSAWHLLRRLIRLDPNLAQAAFRQACKMPSGLKSINENGVGNIPQGGKTVEELLEFRRRYFGKSLSVAYEKPLKIVRGYMQYLYDEKGRAYLDAVNNVCHVGHCHPKVVRAEQRQSARLNTNTRYLHDLIVDYAERLCSTLPDPLTVCFFVNSGSEANELALRLARAHTNRFDVIVVEGAYHGNTASMIDLSPYKFDGPGGKGAPSHVHRVPLPDLYRGSYRAGDPEAGKRYASAVRAIMESSDRENRRVAAFFCESLPGCAGQIVLPERYLGEAFQYVRQGGGVCVVDEVQVGFGRVGSHFWGFETQGVVPDIVTMGKPIGNGHPIGAVVTTPEIADSFDDGMEYFNTFGGNPVSCAVGLAVLDVIEEEELQRNALRVGARMKRDLGRLMEKHPLIGDVRGLGLFLGVELVRNRETLAPAPEEASQIVNRMKEEGILLSVDGLYRNVLKIKPPMVFSEANAEFLVNSLDTILSEGFYK